MEKEIKGQKTLLVEVRKEDAEDICMLRNNPSINKYLSNSQSISVEQQQQWIERNRKSADGFYFKIIDLADKSFCGTVSLYNVKNNQAEFGRYICLKSLQAVETEYIILKFAFLNMKIGQLYCRTAVDNIKVWKQHIRYGFNNGSEEELLKSDGKELTLKVQRITSEQFEKADYSFIDKILNKF